MPDIEGILGGVIIVLGMLGYSTLIPTPATPRNHWIGRSVAASGVVVGCALAAVLLWDSRDGIDRESLLYLLPSVGPYALGGGLVLAAGTYLKVHLWSMKDEAMDRWLSKHE